MILKLIKTTSFICSRTISTGINFHWMRIGNLTKCTEIEVSRNWSNRIIYQVQPQILRRATTGRSTSYTNVVNCFLKPRSLYNLNFIYRHGFQNSSRYPCFSRPFMPQHSTEDFTKVETSSKRRYCNCRCGHWPCKCSGSCYGPCCWKYVPCTPCRYCYKPWDFGPRKCGYVPSCYGPHCGCRCCRCPPPRLSGCRCGKFCYGCCRSPPCLFGCGCGHCSWGPYYAEDLEPGDMCKAVTCKCNLPYVRPELNKRWPQI